MEYFDILIVGAGAAGISAAKAAAEHCKSILLVDCAEKAGGVLLQCAHPGFGDGLTGPAYAARLLQDFPDTVCFSPRTAVLEITKEKTARLSDGRSVAFSQLIWAAGCYEKPMGALPVAGTRPHGIYTAGQMQAMIHLHGFRPEGPVVILGSGDLGLIMAWHLSEMGIRVTIVEQKATSSGLAINRSRLSPYMVPIHCSTTVTEVFGHPNLESVALSDGTILPCQTLLIAAGLTPERSLIRHIGNQPWLHLCGNCRTIRALVDSVVYEGARTGLAAAKNLRGIT